MKPTFEQAAQYGFVFPNARMWLSPENRARIAEDAALVTTPNTTVPAELLAYIDPMVIEIMTAPRRAREIFGEDRNALFRMKELWVYMAALFPGREKEMKKIRKSSGLAEYNAAVDAVFDGEEYC